MAVSIIPGSARLKPTQWPTVSAPVINSAASEVHFDCGQQILATGSVRFNVAPGDATTGWFVGWLQAQWIETNWGYYRGQLDNEGSAFHQRGRPPARPHQACRDTFGPVSQIFYGVEPTRRGTIPFGPFPAHGGVLVSARFNDGPSETYPLKVTNSLTHKTNWLHEIQLEFHFCTVLVVRDPAGVFTQLKALYWNVRWQYRLHPSAFPPTDANTRKEPIAGGVTDRRFTGVLTSHQAKSCNDFATDESAHPNVRESRRWANFDVTR